VFSQYLHIRPWEIPLLTAGQFENLIDYCEENIIKGG
jgi:hypothetical protein